MNQPLTNPNTIQKMSRSDLMDIHNELAQSEDLIHKECPYCHNTDLRIEISIDEIANEVEFYLICSWADCDQLMEQIHSIEHVSIIN